MESGQAYSEAVAMGKAQGGGWYRREQGFTLVEAALVFAVLAFLVVLVPPHAARLYRSALVEYETQHFLSEVRYVQRISRTTEELDNQRRPIGEAGLPELMVMEADNRYMLTSFAGKDPLRILRTYTLHGGVRIRLTSNKVRSGWPISVRFTPDGLVDYSTWGRSVESQPGYTFHIFVEGHPEEGSQVIIDRVGRIRVEREDRSAS